jgi:hypothetical protein
MRLNGWQRIGIVASVIWAIGAPIYMDSAAERDADEKFSWVQCFQRASRAYESVPRYHFTSANGAFVALAPIPVGWLIAYALVYLVRWIRAGFKP